jgi:hypothetical protein
MAPSSRLGMESMTLAVDFPTTPVDRATQQAEMR